MSQKFENGDTVIADKGFQIVDILPLGVKLNILPFLEVNTQMSAEDIVQTPQIAELRIHVERAINKIKNFLIWEGRNTIMFILCCLPDVECVCLFVQYTRSTNFWNSLYHSREGGKGLQHETDRDAFHIVNLGVLASDFLPRTFKEKYYFLHLPRPCLDLGVFDHRSLSHSQIGLLQGFHSKFSIRIPFVSYGSPLPYTVSFSLIFLHLRRTSRTG